jgi:cytochrome P450/NADPH-cytochrome P450 reductase
VSNRLFYHHLRPFIFWQGEPPDNAGHFVQCLKNLPLNSDLANIQYTVFGCGNHEWVNTYQRIPKLCDDLLEKNGAQRFFQRGEADAGGPTFFEEFDEWEAKMWPALIEVRNSCRSPVGDVDKWLRNSEGKLPNR